MTASAGPALKQLYLEYGDRVAFVTLYVREAHPGERYPQPDSFEEKLHHARAYQQRDGIPWPVAVDDIEGNLHRTLDPKPNAAYVMDRDGNVAFRALWSNDETALREGLAAIVATRQRPIGESRAKMVPMLAGMGKMYEVLNFAGEQAKQDVFREVPPLYGMAWLASCFRPLSPFGRGVAATAVSFLGLVAFGSLGWRLLKQR